MNKNPETGTSNRIMIIGCAGSGKSTLAIKLGKKMRLPVIHLDRLFWQPGWVSIPREALAQMIKEQVRQPQWIIDGNYTATLDLRLAACDTVIFLDMPCWLCLWNVIKRRVRYHKRSRPDISEGCPEQLDWEFLSWIWHFNRDKRPLLLEQLAELPPEKQVIHMTKARQVEGFLASLD